MKKQPKIFTIGGATFDIFIKAADQAVMQLATPDSREKWLCLKYGGKVIVQHVTETFGGGATNTAVAFARMGFESCFVGMIGTQYGERVIENLEKERVRTDCIRKTSRDKTAFSTIINTFDGDRTVLGYAGANRFFDADHLPLKELEQADWIFLNHLTKPGSKIPQALIKLLKANPHIKLAWNPGHEQLVQGLRKWKVLLEHTEILFVNKEEASLFARTPYRLAGIKKDDPECHIHVQRNFLPPYADDVSGIMMKMFETGVKNVVITDGRNGAQASDGKRIFFCPVVSHKRVDTLGAGDAFASGFTTALILGKNLKTALSYGTLNANSVVSCFGAQEGLLRRKAIEKLKRVHPLCISSSRLVH